MMESAEATPEKSTDLIPEKTIEPVEEPVIDKSTEKSSRPAAGKPHSEVETK